MGSFKKPQGLGPTPNQFIRITKGGTRRGLFTLKLPRCFQGAAKGEDYYFIVSLGELHICKAALFVRLSDYQSNACCLKRNQRTHNLQDDHVCEPMCSLKIFLNTWAKKNPHVSCNKVFPIFSKRFFFFKFWGLLKCLGIIDNLIGCLLIFLKFTDFVIHLESRYQKC